MFDAIDAKTNAVVSLCLQTRTFPRLGVLRTLTAGGWSIIGTIKNLVVLVVQSVRQSRIILLSNTSIQLVFVVSNYPPLHVRVTWVWGK